MPQPAEELQKYAVMIGNWEGSGTAVMAPGAEASPWTAVSSVQWILGGHFVQEDITIDLGMGVPLIFRSLYGWDVVGKRPVVHAVSNTVEHSGPNELRWLDDKTLTGVSIGVHEGKPKIERWTSRFSKDGYTVLREGAAGDGAFFTHVSGAFKRATGKSFSARAEEASVSFEPQSEALKRFAPLVGEYTFEGRIAMSPEMSPEASLHISGKEVVDWMLGGQVLTSHVVGDPSPEGYAYEGNYYTWCWNPSTGAIRSLGANNMGELVVHDVHWEGTKTLVHLSSGLFADWMTGGHTPGVIRVVTELGEHGLSHVYADSSMGAEKPFRSFEVKYARAGAKTAQPATLTFKPGSCCARAQSTSKACAHPCCVSAAAAGVVCAKCNS